MPSGLGRRNAALLALRTARFGRAWPLRSRCPACGAECAFEIDSGVLAGALGQEAPPAVERFDWNGHALEARAPTIDDVAAVAGAADPASAALAIIGRCIAGDLDLETIDQAGLDELGRRMEHLDPGAAVGFDLACPGCAGEWTAMIDVGEALWLELRGAAERLLVEVDALARAYGWTEDEIMCLSPTRRAAYLQFVEAA
jgi:hypothetical protein